MISPTERRQLWDVYPEVRELFEEYNGTLLEDDGAWARFVDRCHGIRDAYHGSSVVETMLQDAALELERLAKKRKYG